MNKAQFDFLNIPQPDAARYILDREGRCTQTLALARYAARLLSDEDQVRMILHLNQCRDCRDTLAEHVKNERRVRIVPPRSSRPDDEARDREYDAMKDSL